MDEKPMINATAVDIWLSQMSFSHSNSEKTKRNYRYYFKKFEEFAGAKAEQIIADYEKLDDKQFKRKYTPTIMGFVGQIQTEKYSPATQNVALNTVKSFFKYHNLPLNFLPSGRQYTVFHNRDITKEEIEAIIKDAQPREKAYYALMTQSGLRPNEISNLKIGDLEGLLQEDTPIPCMITIRQEATKGKYKPYFTFAGKETITSIKEYFKREKRTDLTPEDYLFTKVTKDRETKETKITKTDSDLISHIFRRTVRKLKNEKVLNFNNKKSEKTNRNELRLYNLRKYFRNHAGQAGTDYVNFWMGHSLGIDEHYFSQTAVADHRKQYQEKAMPNLRIETKTPDQNEDTITKLEQENRELKERLKRIEDKLFANEQEIPDEIPSTDEEDQHIEKQIREHDKWEEEHPEEAKKLNEELDKAFEENEKYLEQHPEIDQQIEEKIRAYETERLVTLEREKVELRKLFKEFKEKRNK
jgi:site-specific recombinase XerD